MITRFLHGLGRATVARPWRTLAAWVLVAVVASVTTGVKPWRRRSERWC